MKNKKSKDSSHTARKAGSAAANWQTSDAEYAKEQSRYADPIPSRNLILDTLAAHEGPLTLDELVGAFQLGKLTQQEALPKRLVPMVREGQLMQNRRGAYGPLTERTLIAGSVHAHRDGVGFLSPDAGGQDVS